MFFVSIKNCFRGPFGGWKGGGKVKEIGTAISYLQQLSIIYHLAPHSTLQFN